ncbi:twin-arginine translocation signal domain-containing protein, partial [candidate division KSB1 bacterium]|nr:twin-arginine translocation signal domain-containing protein [candidate division KSB1 bacterium]
MSNKLSRRDFIKTASGVGAAIAAVAGFPAIVTSKTRRLTRPGGKLPVLVCSRGEDWGRKTNGPGWEILSGGGNVLDAVEKAANVTELDPEDTSVGYG